MLKLKSLLLILLLGAAFSAGCASRTPAPATPVQSGYMDAVDLKQKFADLADQLVSSLGSSGLKGYVAIPSSFVNENNPGQAYPLGRLLAESMEYEFNQKGFVTREYNPSGKVTATGSMNDMALASTRRPLVKGQKQAAVLVGTYQIAKDATFVNARLVRPGTAIVLSTADLVLPNTALVSGLESGAQTYSSHTRQASSAYVAPQSAPILAPTYPSLAGSVIQRGTAGIPIVQGR